MVQLLTLTSSEVIVSCGPVLVGNKKEFRNTCEVLGYADVVFSMLWLGRVNTRSLEKGIRRQVQVLVYREDILYLFAYVAGCFYVVSRAVALCCP